MEDDLLRCEWIDCQYQDSTTMAEFCTHMIQHSPFLENRDDETGTVTTWYCCMWECCGFDSQNYEQVVFHINYHAYHTKIKNEGAKLISLNNLPQCHLDFAGRNLFARQPDFRICEWNQCGAQFNNYQYFLWHVETHMQHEKGRSNAPVPCQWPDCLKQFKGTAKLKSHGKVHTGEREVGCPTCGTQFANKTKLIDHCTRQSSAKKYKCSHCFKSYPSERILRDHIRLHIDCYKCPMCDVTFPFPYTLNLHIRYKHINDRPFKCNFCDFRNKTEKDRENHQLTHCNENFWACEKEGCDFSCRAKSSFMRHMAKRHHEGIVNPYVCHICDFQCGRGAFLTKHLQIAHSYRWTIGQTKFRYIKGEDGLYRLQTFRYAVTDISQDDFDQSFVENKIFRCTKVAADQFVITVEDLEPIDKGTYENVPVVNSDGKSLENAIKEHFKLPRETTIEITKF